MRTWAAFLLIAFLSAAAGSAQTRRSSAGKRVTPIAPATKTEPAMISCPQVLGHGVKTERIFCDVLIGRDPAGGIIVTLPPHTGTVTLRFDLHNRHTYSEELIKANRAYHRYTATVGVLTMDNTLISRAVVQNEFRSAADLVDRIAGGSGPGGLKAVAPTGLESIAVTLPAGEERVSILGEKLSIIRADGADIFSASGRPAALISSVTVEYQPPPVRRPAVRRR